ESDPKKQATPTTQTDLDGIPVFATGGAVGGTGFRFNTRKISKEEHEEYCRRHVAESVLEKPKHAKKRRSTDDECNQKSWLSTKRFRHKSNCLSHGVGGGGGVGG